MKLTTLKKLINSAIEEGKDTEDIKSRISKILDLYDEDKEPEIKVIPPITMDPDIWSPGPSFPPIGTQPWDSRRYTGPFHIPYVPEQPSTCMHDNCSNCHGTGISSLGGGMCVHNMSCPCPKCSFYCSAGTGAVVTYCATTTSEKLS